MKSFKCSLSMLGVLGLVVVFSLVFAVSAAAESGRSVMFNPSHVLKLDKRTKVTIMGSGFKPGQEVRLVIKQPDGSITDIGHGLDPEPVASKDGIWATAWTLGRYSRKGLAQQGLNLLQVCDEGYNVLVTAPFGYYNAKKPYKEWPSWARAVVKEPKKKK